MANPCWHWGPSEGSPGLLVVDTAVQLHGCGKLQALLGASHSHNYRCCTVTVLSLEIVLPKLKP